MLFIKLFHVIDFINIFNPIVSTRPFCFNSLARVKTINRTMNCEEKQKSWFKWFTYVVLVLLVLLVSKNVQ